MRRGTPKRLTALLGAVLFLLTAAGEGFGLHTCPYHSADAPAETAGDEPVGHHTSSHHAGGDSRTHTELARSDAQTSTDHHSGANPCTHFEACQTAAGAVIPMDVATVEIGSVTLVTPAVIVAHEHSLPTPPSFLLPYGQAPPARG